MASPNYFQQFNLDTNMNNNPDQFIIEDLLDFSNDDDTFMTDVTVDSITGNSTDSSTITTAVDSCISSSDPNALADIGSRNTSNGNFSGDLCVPYDDIAELEWLSNFVEESFSSEDPMQLIPVMDVPNDDVLVAYGFQPEPTVDSPILSSEVSAPPPPPPKVPAKARSKRTRGPPRDWASRLCILSPSLHPSPSPTTWAEDPHVINPTPTEPKLEPAPEPSPVIIKKPVKANPKKRDSSEGSSGGDGRRCLHCATDKTPQWRTGPLGPKTLCNACGVRFKSGRLVPEYRPAASPTFVLAKHSNSHRKVLELRRQKEMVRVHVHQHQHQHPQFLQHHHQQHQNMMFDVSNSDDYLIHEHVGPHFQQLMQ